MTVTFSPTLVQAYSGTVTVNSDKTGGTNTASISGTGTAVTTRIIVLLGNLTFGNVPTNSYKMLPLTISNAGNSVLSISNIVFPSGFGIYTNSNGGTNYFSASIPANSAKSVDVIFRPTIAQAYGGTVTVNSDKTSGTNTASISGTGIATMTTNFNYTGNYAPWIVPAGVRTVAFELRGATGGDGKPILTYGGCGASVSGTLSATSGQVVYVFVGGGGQHSWLGSLGGFNGGGYGAGGGGGGGASDIRVGGTQLSNRVAVAGGGGGANGNWGGYGGGSANNSVFITGVFGIGQNASGVNSAPYGNYGGGGGGYFGGVAGGNSVAQWPSPASSGIGGSSWTDTNVVTGTLISTLSETRSGENGLAYGTNARVKLTYTTVPLLLWRNLHFLSEAEVGDSANSFDFDGDGFQNLAEYALDGNPKVPDASTIAPTVATSGNQVQISFTCDTTRTDISYIVQASSDLSAGSWVDIAESTGGAVTQPISGLSTVLDDGAGSRLVTVTDLTSIPSGGKRFLRLLIANPAQ